MFGWRRKRDGFEWRSYVRTTILVKRQKRRERLDEAKQAALDQLAEAGRAGKAAGQSGLDAAGRGFEAAQRGAKSAAGVLGRQMLRGAGVLGQAARDGGRRAGAGLLSAGQAAGRGIGRASGSGLDSLATGIGGVGRSMSPRLSLPLLIAGTAAAIGAGTRGGLQSFDGVAMSAAVLAVVLFGFAALPLIAGRATLDEPFQTRRAGDPPDGEGEDKDGAAAFTGGSPALQRAVAVILALLVLGGGAGAAIWYGGPAVMELAQFKSEGESVSEPPAVIRLDTAERPSSSRSSSPPPPPAAPRDRVSGFAKALSGDTMLIDKERIVLKGIEAPESRQTCKSKNGRNWSCGRSALNALRRITGYDTVVCQVRSTDAAGRRLADCDVKGENIAAQLVRQGHVFATAGLFGGYRREEEEAKGARRGIWQGDAERPSDFREKRWELAKLRAPNGCPIKGKDQVRSRDKVYILPWSARYESYRMSERRGDRWFCSEEEALTAGFRPYES